MGAHLNPLGLFLRTSIQCTLYMACSECLPTRLNPLAERTCYSQVPLTCAVGAAGTAVFKVPEMTCA
jgi:hypothetical protein